jgi:O-antigen/teichoic acid export membrane protein
MYAIAHTATITDITSHADFSREFRMFGNRNMYLGRGFSWALSSNIVYSISQWAYVVVLAKLGTPADLGAYALGLAISTPVLMFANFQGRNFVASDVNNQCSFGEHLAFRITCFGIALGILSVGLMLAHSSPAQAAIVLLVGLGQALDYVSETYFGVLQRYERLDRVSLSLMVKGPLGLLLMTSAMLISHNVLLAVAALVGGRCAVLCLMDTRNLKAIAGPYHLVWNRGSQWKLLGAAFPLGIISSLGAANLNMPRYFVEADLGKTELGLFSALASAVGAGNLVIAALASCSMVSLAKAWANRNRTAYWSLCLRLLAVSGLVGAAGVIVSILVGKDVLVVLFKPEYAKNSDVFVRVMISAAIGYVVSAQGYALTAARKLVAQIPILAASTVVAALCSWYLVPKYGLKGAADVWIIGSVFQLICSSQLLRKMNAGLTAEASAESMPGVGFGAETTTEGLS